jgi:hypothetical protein
VLAALLAAAPAGAEWVEWIADAELDARFDSNLNQALKSSEQEWDLAFLPSLAGGRVYQLAERTRVAASALLAGEIHSRFDELNAAAGEGRVSLSHKLGLGDAPWARAFVGGGYQHVEAAQRRGTRFDVGAELGKRLSPRFDARLSYRYLRRTGQDGPRAVVGLPDDVFDQQGHEVALEGSFLATERLLVTAGFGYRRGDFDANLRSGRMELITYTKVDAVAQDEVFGGWVYRIEGNGYSPFASLSWALGDRWSLDSGYRFRYAEGRGQSYRNHTASVAVLFRY